MNIRKSIGWRACSAVALMLSANACGPLHHSSSTAKPFCTPPWSGAGGAPTAWRLNGYSRNDSSVGFDVAAPALSGTWDMLTVATQGDDGARLERWKLRFVVADSAARNPCRTPLCRLDTRTVQIVAVGAPLGDSPFDSTRLTRDVSAGERTVARYDRSNNHVTFDFGPPMLDAGTFYAVTEVSDSTIAGRWLDGSYMGFFVRRGDVTTLEHPEGFFCGRKVR